MPSVTDLNRFHADADNYVRRLDGIVDQYGSRGGRRGDPAKLKSELQALARDLQGQANINRDNYQYAELNDILGPLIAKSETKQGSVNFALVRYNKWKNERNRKLEEKVQEQEDAERAEREGTEAREKKAKEAKAKKAAEAKAVKTVQDKTVGVKAEEEETETEEPKEKPEEKEEAELESAETKERVAREKAESPIATASAAAAVTAPAANLASTATPTPNLAQRRVLTPEEQAAVSAAAERQRAGREAGPVSPEQQQRWQEMQAARQDRGVTPEEARRQAEGYGRALSGAGRRTLTPAEQEAIGKIAAERTGKPTQATTGKSEAAVSVSAAQAPASAPSAMGEVEVTAEAKASPATATRAVPSGIEVTATVQTQGAAQPVGGQISVSAQSKVERAATERGIPAGAEALIFATPAEAAAIYASIATPMQNQIGKLDTYIKGTSRNFDPKEFSAEIKTASNDINRLQKDIKSMPAAQKKTAEYKNLTQQIGAASKQLNDFSALPQVRNIEKDASPEALRGVAPTLPALSQAIAAPSAPAGAALQAPSTTSNAAAALGELGKGMEAAKQALQEERNRLAVGGEIPEAAGETPKLPKGTSLKRQPLRMPSVEPTQRPGTSGATSERAQTLRGDTPVTDQSIGLGGDEQRTPVIELPARSTTEGQVFHAGAPMYGEQEEEGEELGGGLMIEEAMELQRSQARARRMQATAGAFAPGAAALGAGLAQAPGQEESYDVDVSELQGEEEEEGEGPEEMAPGGQSAVDQALQMAKDKVMEKAKQKVKDEAMKQLEKAGMKVASKSAGATVRVGTEAAEAGTAPESIGITLLILIAQLNLQLVLKYIFKSFGTVASSMGVGTPGQELGEATGFSAESEKAESCVRGFAEQSFAEDVLTVFLDCLMCSNFLFMPPFCFCTIIIIVIIAGIGVVGSVVGLDKIVGAISNLF